MLPTRFIIFASLYLVIIAADVDDVHDRIADGVVIPTSNDKDVSQLAQHAGRSTHLEAPQIESKKKEQTRGSARRRPGHRQDTSSEVSSPKNRTDVDEATKPRSSRRNSMELMVQSASESDALKGETFADKSEAKNATVVDSSKSVNASADVVAVNNETNSTNSSKMEFEIRRKNTVAMSQRLYNHFRPVEENIPIEERTQFLFFGQKLMPGQANVTELASASSSKRRYTIKRFNATAASASKTRNVTSDERQVAETASNSAKAKSSLRAAASSSYYRKAGLGTTDSTIVTNIIQNSSGQHSIDNETKSKKMEMKMEPRSSNKHATGSANQTSAMENSIIGSRQASANVTVNGSAVAENRKPLIWRNNSSRTKKNETVEEKSDPKNGTRIVRIEKADERKLTVVGSQKEGAKMESASVAPVASQYAYTISNVTRLLRNYTGPGLSNSEAGSGATGTSEIKKSAVLLRLLLLVPTPRTAIEEAGRSRSELSAGTTVEQITTQVEPVVGKQRTGKGSTASQVYQAPGGIVVVTSSRGAEATGRWTNLTYAQAGARPVKLAEREQKLHVWRSDPVTQLSKVARNSAMAKLATDSLSKGEQPQKVNEPAADQVSGTTTLPAGTDFVSTISDSDDYRTTIVEVPREEMDNQIVKMPTSSAKPYRLKQVTSTQATTQKYLDPSEIQKKYRSRPTSRTPSTTQELPKDKDDVLPIMNLYNTSSIFNDTNIMGSRSRIEAVLRSKQLSSFRLKDEKKETSEAVTTDANDLVNAAKAESRSRNNTARRRLPDSTKDENKFHNASNEARARQRTSAHQRQPDYSTTDHYPIELNQTFFEPGLFALGPRESRNFSDVIFKRHDGDAIATQETVAVVSYILATLVVFPIAVGVGLILRRLIIRNRKVLEESDTSSEISCKKDALNLENGDFKTSLENAITKLPRIQHLCHETEKLPPVSSDKSRWEFSRDKLRLQTVLGEGNFGQVWKAEADDLTGHQGTTRLVAVKTVKEGASDREKEDLVRELEIMQRVGSHPNVVTLLGCCTEEEPHYLILEYVMYGKLLTYLRDHRTRQDFYNFSEDSAALTSRDLTVFGYCVARGMEYLVSKKIIHRDLAARNVLVDHNKLCKIADFGMSRFANEDGEVIETRHGRNALPIRWMAPESLIYSLFTTKTDVWSFGILMWEIVTLGSTPYPDMTARDVMRNVQSGYRLERPSHCRNELFRVILRCWHADPDRRPEFSTIRRDLAQLLEDNMNGQYVDLESFASECID